VLEGAFDSAGSRRRRTGDKPRFEVRLDIGEREEGDLSFAGRRLEAASTAHPCADRPHGGPRAAAKDRAGAMASGQHGVDSPLQLARRLRLASGPTRSNMAAESPWPGGARSRPAMSGLNHAPAQKLRPLGRERRLTAACRMCRVTHGGFIAEDVRETGLPVSQHIRMLRGARTSCIAGVIT